MAEHSETPLKNADRIRELNDRLRRTLTGGAICITRGVCERCDTNAVLAAVQTFDTFNHANDPWGERDFGALTIDGQDLFWKVDYYGPGMQGGSPDAADPRVTERVLTVMLAEEY
jgi:hypothetical protein